MIMMDLFYLENMSILLDLKIMLKTGAVIVGQLFESRHAAQSVAKQTVQSLKEEISTSVLGTTTQGGFETNRPSKNTLEEMV